MNRAIAAIVFALWYCCASLAAATAADVDVASLTSSGLGRQPVVGEWLEYVIAFPVDPLENSLRPAPLPPPPSPLDTEPADPVDPAAAAAATDAQPAGRFSLAPPEFEAPVAWRVLPLRITIAGRTDSGFHAVVNLDGASRPVVLPAASPVAPSPGAAPDGTATQKIGDLFYDVQVFRDPDPETGFIRHVNAHLPFGLARFATPYVDVILVDMGSGDEPPFPSARADASPPPGALWR